MRGQAMINLFVAGMKDTWESNPTIFYKDRALTEYIQPEFRAKYGSFSPEAIAAIKKMPCLFACEDCEHQDVYIGYITDISVRSNNIKIGYRLTGDYIRFDVFQTMEDILDMGPWEHYRTHWTIKDVELSEIEPYFAKENGKGEPKSAPGKGAVTPQIEPKPKMPRVFVSYCWSPPEHKTKVLSMIERIKAEDIDVCYDEADLHPGQDMNYFMESALRDPSIDHVLVVCNEEYAKRANARTSGAGYESGLILSEIRDDPKQTKYIPVVLDADADLGTCLPVFLKSRLCLKISNDEGFRKLIDAIKRR